MDAAGSAKVLWRHPNPQSTQMYRFKTLIEQKYNVTLPEYENLRQWSLDNLNSFWEEVWDFTQIVASKPYVKVRALWSKYLVDWDRHTEDIRPSKTMYPCSHARRSSKVPG